MKFSVIVPVYNPPRKLFEHCVQSLLENLNHCKADAECIFVNDGSTVDYIDTLLKDVVTVPGVTYVKKENGGVSSARNVGLELAKGEYITFIDSDDFMEDNILEYANQLIKLHHASFLVLGMVYDNWDGYGAAKVQLPFSCVKEGADIQNYICDLISGNLSLSKKGIMEYSVITKFYQHSLLRKYNIRFLEDLTFAEDFIFNIEYLIHIDKMYIDNCPAFHYVRNIDSSVNKINPSRMEMCYLLIEKLEQYVDKYFRGNEAFQHALYLHTLFSIRNGMQAYFTHPDNHQSFKALKCELSTFLSFPTYKKMIKALKISDGTNYEDRRDIFLLKNKFYWILLITKPIRRKVKFVLRSFLKALNYDS